MVSFPDYRGELLFRVPCIFICTLLYRSRVELEDIERLSFGDVFKAISVCFQLIVSAKLLWNCVVSSTRNGDKSEQSFVCSNSYDEPSKNH